MPTEIRDYRPADEQAWLRCRVLSFLSTAYFDDVMTAKQSPAVGAELVAVKDGVVVGILDFSMDGMLATIDTVGVHPDHQRQGIGTQLFYSPASGPRPSAQRHLTPTLAMTRPRCAGIALAASPKATTTCTYTRTTMRTRMSQPRRSRHGPACSPSKSSCTPSSNKRQRSGRSSNVFTSAGASLSRSMCNDQRPDRIGAASRCRAGTARCCD